MSIVVRDYMTDSEFFDISPDDRKAELIDGDGNSPNPCQSPANLV